MSDSKSEAKRGVTLTETLVVISVIVALASLLIPAVLASRESARRTVCSNKLRQIGLALAESESAQGHFSAGNAVDPAGVDAGCPRPPDSSDETQPWTLARAPWTVQVLPFLEEQGLYRSFNMDMPFMSDLTDKATAASTFNLSQQLVVVEAFQCPSDPNSKRDRPNNNYYGVMGDGLGEVSSNDGWPTCSTREDRRRLDRDGMLFLNSAVSRVPKGRSKTYLVGEQRRQLPEQSWASAANVSKEHGTLRNLSSTLLPMNVFPFTPPREVVRVRGVPVRKLGFDYDEQLLYLEQSFSSYHVGGCYFSMVDGSVRFETNEIDMRLYRGNAKRDSR